MIGQLRKRLWASKISSQDLILRSVSEGYPVLQQPPGHKELMQKYSATPRHLPHCALKTHLILSLSSDLRTNIYLEPISEESGDTCNCRLWDAVTQIICKASIGNEMEVVRVGLVISGAIQRCNLSGWCNGGTLTHWGWDKMAGISQTTLSIVFSWMKMLEFRLNFHWSLFLTVQLTMS